MTQAAITPISSIAASTAPSLPDQVILQFITKASERVATAIAAIERDAVREEARREAEHQLRMARIDNQELEFKALIQQLKDDQATLVAGVQNTVMETLSGFTQPADGKDGERGADAVVDQELIAVLVAEEVERAVSVLKPAEPVHGKDGTSVTLDEAIPALIADAEARLFEITGIPDAITKAAPQLVDWAVLRVLQAMPPIERGEKGEDGTSVTLEDVTPLVEEAVREAVAAIPPPENGKDGSDGADGRDGTSVTLEDVLPLVELAVNAIELPVPENGKDGADGKDGASVTLEDIAPLVEAMARQAILDKPFIETVLAAIPTPENGRDGKDGKDGTDGAPGTLPEVRDWTDEEISYKGSVVRYEGSTYQARKDTAKVPTHDDWVCIAQAGAPGERGADGKSFEIRGTYSATTVYTRLDVVVSDGAAFVAKKDAPGPLPGADWQMIAQQGKRGKPGPQGIASVIEGVRIDEVNATITLVDTSGRETVIDLYSILSQLR